jgi:hypothetical protein
LKQTVDGKPSRGDALLRMIIPDVMADMIKVKGWVEESKSRVDRRRY